MKTLYYLGIACVAAFTLSACGDDSPSTGGNDNTDDPNAHKLGIQTTVQIKAPVTVDFKENDKMNIFVKTSESPSGNDKVAGAQIMATRTASGWELSPEVNLSKGDVCYVYAVAPFNANYKDASASPVDTREQVDLLYSGATVCSYQTHNVTLTMKHALSLMTFNIEASGYNGAGNIEALSVGGEIVYTKGTMNASNGRIIGTSTEQVTVDCSAKVGDKSHPGVWVIPFNNKGKIDGAKLTAVIDGKTYTVTVPEVEMRLGYQYSFKMALTNYGLTFIPGGLETVSLNGEGSEVVIPESHGVVTFKINAPTWISPAFSGDGVFGNTQYGDKSTSYASGAEIATGGNATVGIETWNSTGFEIHSLAGVEEIDISNF